MSKSKEKVLGFAKFGAFMHRDNGGRMKIAAYSSVNKDLAIEGDHDETTKIASRTYKIVEEENAVLNGNKFYSKDVWNEQSGEGDVKSYTDPERYADIAPPTAPNKEGLTPLQVLKNFVDNLAADFRQDRTAQWIVIVGLAVLVGVAITLHFVR